METGIVVATDHITAVGLWIVYCTLCARSQCIINSSSTNKLTASERWFFAELFHYWETRKLQMASWFDYFRETGTLIAVRSYNDDAMIIGTACA